MRNLILNIMYEGTAYHGFCVQPGLATIQSELEGALFRLTGEKIRIIGAGRTDRGVHADGQIVNFRTKSKLPAERIKAGLNALLPEDIRILEAGDAGGEFHARFNAKEKSYVYTVFEGEQIPYQLKRFALLVRPGIKVSRLKQAGTALLGSHDFKAFAAEVKGKNAVRTLKKVSVQAVREKLGRKIEIKFTGDGFLYKMVRSLVGTLLEIGYGRREIPGLVQLLRDPDRSKVGRTAPAHGLRLSEVKY